jgi:hypothetical protein
MATATRGAISELALWHAHAAEKPEFDGGSSHRPGVGHWRKHGYVHRGAVRPFLRPLPFREPGRLIHLCEKTFDDKWQYNQSAAGIFAACKALMAT